MILAAVPPYDIESRFEPGLSEESRYVWEQTENFRRKGREPISFSWRESLQGEIHDVLRSCSSPGWDGYDAEPIATDSVASAALILNALPDHIIPPSVTPEPDGEIALEWRTGRRTDFSVSISGTTLSYAGIFGGSSKRYGEEPFFGVLPAAIFRILAEYFSQA